MIFDIHTNKMGQIDKILVRGNQPEEPDPKELEEEDDDQE